ncbi:MAG: universal stress protein [Deltaproteobacteria bacterium]|nr:universal stress protein [Deltaproteobacteria bacterium]
MEKITKILAPTDLSELSEAGVRYALNLAKAVGAEVTVYNVVSSEELMRYGERMKDRIIGDASLSAPASVLEKYQVALGSVTEKVVRRAPCPVLSIRPAKEQAAVQKSIAA